MKIRTQLGIFSALLVLLSVGGVASFLYYSGKKALFREMEAKQKATIEQLAQIGREALLMKDDLLLLNYVNLIKKTTPAVVYAFIESPKGRILAHTDPMLIDAKDDTPAAEPALRSEGILRQDYIAKSGLESPSYNKSGLESPSYIDFSNPIYLGKEKAAVARVGFSKAELDGMISRSLAETRTRIMGVAAVNLLIGLFIALLIATAISRPVQALSAGASEIGKGNFYYELEIKSKSEIGHLASTFNEMARQLKELDEMKRDFVSSVTHELRSPLAAIDSYISMMMNQMETQIVKREIPRLAGGRATPFEKKGEIPRLACGGPPLLQKGNEGKYPVSRGEPPLLQKGKGESGELSPAKSAYGGREIEIIWKDNFARIKKNTVRLSKFIDDLLDVSKIEAGKLDVCPEEIEYEPVIRDMVELFTPKAAEQGIDLSFEMEKDLPRVLGDANRLKQVITNLVGNALKFTPSGGGIKVRAFLSNKDGGRMVETAVSDTGFGIPEDKIEKIFSKFEQVKEHRDKVKGQKGTGLGLAIAKAIVEMHSGTIWIKSRVNEGTTFHFTLPAVEA